MRVLKQSKHCKLIELTMEEAMELSGLAGFKPEIMEEKEMTDGFRALRGKYKAVVKNFERYKNSGTSDSGFEWAIDKLQVDFQITATVEGDKGDNRYVRKEFDLANEEWCEESIKRFLSMVMTITKAEPDYQYAEGDTLDITVGKVAQAADPIIGKLCNLTIYPATEKKDWTAKDGTVHKKGDIRKNYKGDEEMVVLVVAEHKTKGAKTASKKTEIISEGF